MYFRLRAFHKVGPLRLSIQSAEVSQAWANSIAKNYKQTRQKSNDILKGKYELFRFGYI